MLMKERYNRTDEVINTPLVSWDESEQDIRYAILCDLEIEPREKHRAVAKRRVLHIDSFKAQELAKQNVHNDELIMYKDMYEAISGSFFWRLTKPLRALKDTLMRAVK